MFDSTTEKNSIRRKNAVLRLTAAVIIAAVLLCLTNFAIGDILSGPKTVTSMDNLSEGSYVAANVDTIYDFYAEDYVSSSDKVTAWYAVIPMDDQLVTVRFPARYFESAKTIYIDPFNYLSGITGPLGRYFEINGTVTDIGVDLETRFYDWFAGNSGWMSETGLILSGDAAQCLSPYMITADNIGPFNFYITYSIIAAALLILLYAVIIGLRLALGGYKDKTAQEEACSETEDYPEDEIHTEPEAFTSADDPDTPHVVGMYPPTDIDIVEDPEEKDVF